MYVKVFDLGTERRVWPRSVYLCMIGYFFVVMWMISHFSAWKDICQSASLFFKLLRSSCSLAQSELLLTVRYRRVSSAKSRTMLLLETYSGRSLMKMRKSTGPKTEPFVTPESPGTDEKDFRSRTTFCNFLREKNLSNPRYFP